MALAVVNAIPDFHQDRLVGKRNLVVRLGRRRGVLLYLALAGAGLAVVPAGVVARRFPARTASLALLAVPLLVASARRAVRHLRAPRAFVAAIRAHRRLLRRRASGCFVVGILRERLRRESTANRIDALAAPLFVSWQLTRDCDLCCLHCCTESAPGKRLPDELDADEAMRVVDEIVRNDVPYVMLCGGEPLVVPHFFAVAEALGSAGVQLKIETNGQRLDDGDRRAPRAAADPLDPDQPRRRHGGDLRAPAPGRLARARRMRPAARVRAAGLPLEITFAPTRLNIHEAPAVIERARALGAFRFNTGKLMRIGTAARLWDALEPTRRAVPAVPRDARAPRGH